MGTFPKEAQIHCGAQLNKNGAVASRRDASCWRMLSGSVLPPHRGHTLPAVCVSCALDGFVKVCDGSVFVMLLSTKVPPAFPRGPSHVRRKRDAV